MHSTILGIDPGYGRMGWAVGSFVRGRWEKVSYGLITTSAELSLPKRYQRLAEELHSIIANHAPDAAALESLFFSKNRTTALKVSEARGVILHTCMDAGMRIFEYTPQQVKQTVTGYGKADKQSVEKMVRQELKLGSERIIDDTIDALAIMITCAAQSKIQRAIAQQS